MKTMKQSKHALHTIDNGNISGVNWCDICEVRVQLYNHVIGKEHECGKKHQSNLKNIKYVVIEE